MTQKNLVSVLTLVSQRESGRHSEHGGRLLSVRPSSLGHPFHGSESGTVNEGRTEHPQNACRGPAAWGDAKNVSHAHRSAQETTLILEPAEAKQRSWGICNSALSYMLQIFLSAPVSNILPCCPRELAKHPHHFNVSVSKLHFLRGLFHPDAAQKSRRPCARIWGMENVYSKERD